MKNSEINQIIINKESPINSEEHIQTWLKNFTYKFTEYYPEPPTEFIELFKFLTNPVSEETEFIKLKQNNYGSKESLSTA